MSNVSAFPLRSRIILAAIEAIEPSALLDDGDREAFRATLEKGIQTLNAGTRQAHGGVRYDLQCAEDDQPLM